MSEHTMMSVEEARELVDDQRFADAEQQRAARMIVAQAAQIERLQAAPREADHQLYDAHTTAAVHAQKEETNE